MNTQKEDVSYRWSSDFPLFLWDFVSPIFSEPGIIPFDSFLEKPEGVFLPCVVSVF
jgi:hypothetical protein